MRALFAFVILASMSAAVSCGAAPLSPGGEPLTLTRLRAEPYSYTFYSGLDAQRRTIVRNAAQWQEIWTEIWKRTSPTPALPSIDFEREMVIVAAMGSMPTGGYSIVIESAAESGRNVNVVIRSASPGRNCGVTQAITQPVDIARVTRRDATVTFTERAETFSCN
ncbi:MAG TPA: protease complex subunit PrcB family protein [Vicinamibacterales bacterium]|nr:protease complex subunit PrcB family protein [Vicinamibacterales bacterium]